MPDSEGKLTAAEKDKIIAWLNKNWKEPTQCPISKDNDWIIGDSIIAPLNYGAEKRMVMGGNIYPLVMLICKTCGFTVFFNAVMMGILPPMKNGEKEGSPYGK